MYEKWIIFVLLYGFTFRDIVFLFLLSVIFCWMRNKITLFILLNSNLYLISIKVYDLYWVAISIYIVSFFIYWIKSLPQKSYLNGKTLLPITSASAKAYFKLAMFLYHKVATKLFFYTSCLQNYYLVGIKTVAGKKISL